MKQKGHSEGAKSQSPVSSNGCQSNSEEHMERLSPLDDPNEYNNSRASRLADMNNIIQSILTDPPNLPN